jgi:hypothetical protein
MAGGIGKLPGGDGGGQWGLEIGYWGLGQRVAMATGWVGPRFAAAIVILGYAECTKGAETLPLRLGRIIL